MCQVYNALGLNPIVRIPSPDPLPCLYGLCETRVLWCGVLAPYIETVAQIREIVGATGTVRSKVSGPSVFSGEEPPEPELQAYLNNFNAGSMCSVNIESVAAIENLDLLPLCSRTDAVIIVNLHDLSVSLGLPEQYEHPEYQKTVGRNHQKIPGKGYSCRNSFSV